MLRLGLLGGMSWESRRLLADAADRAAVHRVIFDELCRGVLREESRHEFRRIIGRLVDSGAEAIALSCTEIELLIGPTTARCRCSPAPGCTWRRPLTAACAGPPNQRCASRVTRFSGRRTCTVGRPIARTPVHSRRLITLVIIVG
jgi:hypothetical protein